MLWLHAPGIYYIYIRFGTYSVPIHYAIVTFYQIPLFRAIRFGSWEMIIQIESKALAVKKFNCTNLLFGKQAMWFFVGLLFMETVSFIRWMLPSVDNGFIIRWHTTFQFESTMMRMKVMVMMLSMVLILMVTMFSSYTRCLTHLLSLWKYDESPETFYF